MRCNEKFVIKTQIEKINTQTNSPVKAFVTVIIDNAFAVHGIKIIESKNELFVEMPSHTYKHSGYGITYTDVFHAVSEEAREVLNQKIIDCYEETIRNMEEIE